MMMWSLKCRLTQSELLQQRNAHRQVDTNGKAMSLLFITRKIKTSGKSPTLKKRGCFPYGVPASFGMFHSRYAKFLKYFLHDSDGEEQKVF